MEALKAYFDWNLWAQLAIAVELLDPSAFVSFQVQVSSVGADYSWAVVGRAIDVAWEAGVVDEVGEVEKSSFGAVAAVAEGMRLEGLCTEGMHTYFEAFALGVARTFGVGHDLATKLLTLESWIVVCGIHSAGKGGQPPLFHSPLFCHDQLRARLQLGSASARSYQQMSKFPGRYSRNDQGCSILEGWDRFLQVAEGMAIDVAREGCGAKDVAMGKLQKDAFGVVNSDAIENEQCL